MAAEEKTIETDKLTDFLQVVESWRNRWKVGERAVYRGHTDFNWILIAKLFRNPDAKPENTVGDSPDQVESQLISEHLPMNEAHNIERRLFNDFSRYLYAHRPDLVCTVAEDKKSNSRSMQEWRQIPYSTSKALIRGLQKSEPVDAMELQIHNCFDDPRVFRNH